MFEIFKKKNIKSNEKNKCKHDLELLGKFYEISNSQYMNGEDYVAIKIRHICKICGEVFDNILTSRGYNVMSCDDLEEKQNFIKEIKLRQDIITDYEMNEKTIEYQIELSKRRNV
ncbi:TPA: hypothetical protein I9089_002343 [Clostridium perfringens]|nr:hypothetical protein [Clostridium perfringens]